MNFLEFIGGQGMFMLLALCVIIVVLYNKLKTRRYHKSNKKRK